MCWRFHLIGEEEDTEVKSFPWSFTETTSHSANDAGFHTWFKHVWPIWYNLFGQFVCHRNDDLNYFWMNYKVVFLTLFSVQSQLQLTQCVWYMNQMVTPGKYHNSVFVPCRIAAVTRKTCLAVNCLDFVAPTPLTNRQSWLFSTEPHRGQSVYKRKIISHRFVIHALSL